MHGLITILIIVTTIIIIVQCWLGREARRGSLTKFASRFARSVSLRYLFITSISTNGKVGSRNIGLRRYYHLVISIIINININIIIVVVTVIIIISIIMVGWASFSSGRSS